MNAIRSHGWTMRRISVVLLAALVCATAQSHAFAASAQDFPRKPVRIIVPYPPGASGDLVARMIGQRLSENFGQSVVIDNRAGGGGIAATDAVAKSSPDGYTLLLTGMNHTTNVGLHASLPFDTERDFAAVSLLGSVPLVLVAHPSTGFKTSKDLIQAAKLKPRTINSGSGGNGTGGHLAMELFARATGIQLVHVPYKGATGAVTAVVSGETQISFAGVPPVLGFIKEGRLVPLLVTSAQRVPTLPGIPTAQETGVAGYEVDVWFGLLSRAGTPPAILKLLSSQVVQIVREAAINSKMMVQGFVPAGSTPEEFEKIIRKDLDCWPRLIREAGIKAE